MFDFSKWIWNSSDVKYDGYVDFLVDFNYNQKAIINISADSHYAIFKQDQLITFGQYADFPHDKVYDSIDISEFCHKGKNTLKITVWYIGLETTAVYCKGNAGLLFEITDGENILAKSDEHTLSRINPYYKSHYEKKITPQLGYSFLYDNTKSETEYTKSVIVNQVLPLRIRPNKKLILEKPVNATLIKKLSDNTYLYDLGSEQVGFISFDIEVQCQNHITISYGEHIADGRVRRIIDARDFSVEFIANKGKNTYINPFRRLGCRYIEITSDKPFDVNYVAIAPTMYPLKEQTKPALCDIHSKIYDICVKTLKLCMHEHYEDCPWREQALYTMDSRNQMLCGYYAFKEYEFARSCLQLISKDNRADGLLSICYPKSQGKVIPSFSLHYITEVLEYYLYSKDISLVKEVFPKIQSVLKVFTDRLENFLILPFPQYDSWNFYEWQPYLDGKQTDLTKRDLILNGLLSYALTNAQKLADIIGIEADYQKTSEKINKAINEVFYDKDRGIYADFEDTDKASVLGNSIAILCSAAKGREKEICEKLINDKTLTPLSLSMLCFKYDVLIKTDKEKYKEYIFNEIENIYTPMLELGNGTVWETSKGESDFKKAGSLCHGWSAMPIYYYNILED